MLKTLPIAAVVLQDIYYTIYANSAGLMANGYYVKNSAYAAWDDFAVILQGSIMPPVLPMLIFSKSVRLSAVQRPP